MTKAILNQYDQIENEFMDDIEDIIDDILGEIASNSQREELYESIKFVLRKYSKEYLNHLKQENNENFGNPFPISCPNFNQITPSINLFIVQAPQSFCSPPVFNYSQLPVSSVIPPNPYQMQIIQSPNPYFNIDVTHPNKSTKSKPKPKKYSHKSKKSKSNSKKHHSKSEKSDKKQQKKSDKKKEPIPQYSRYIEYNESSLNHFNGIIDYLTKKCGGNVSKFGLVDVTSSSVFSHNEASNVVDLDKSNFFEALNHHAPNEWLKYDFKNIKVRPTFYSIRSGNAHGGTYNLKNWVVEGSNDDIEWRLLDTRSDDLSFKNSKTSSFKIQEELKQDECFRFIRIRSTGKDTSGGDIFSMSALEYFGYIFE